MLWKWVTPWKTNMITRQWKTYHLKMYFLLNMVIFQCRVGFQGYKCCVFFTPNKFNTVDGRNPAPPGMVKTLYIMGWSSLVVQDFVHQQYHKTFPKFWPTSAFNFFHSLHCFWRFSWSSCQLIGDDSRLGEWNTADSTNGRYTQWNQEVLKFWNPILWRSLKKTYHIDSQKCYFFVNRKGVSSLLKDHSKCYVFEAIMLVFCGFLGSNWMSQEISKWLVNG